MTLTAQAKAREIRASRRHDAKLPLGVEAEDLALAWLQGDVRAIQIKSTINCSNGSAMYTWLAQRLRDAYVRGVLKVRKGK